VEESTAWNTNIVTKLLKSFCDNKRCDRRHSTVNVKINVIAFTLPAAFLLLGLLLTLKMEVVLSETSDL
jgi:hypothetical protein